MNKQNENPDHLNDSAESLRNYYNNDEISSRYIIDPDDGRGKSFSAPENDATIANYATETEVAAEIERVFKNDPHLMTKLLKTTESFLYGKTGQPTILGKNCEDLVLEGIESILKLERKWYKEKCPNIVVLIIGVIKSNIRNMVNSKDYENKGKIIPLFPENDEYNSGNSVYDDEIARKLSPADFDLTEKSDEEIFQKYLDLFADDLEAYCVLDELLKTSDYDVKEQNQLLAKNLGITVTQVENAKKRIKYKVMFIKNSKGGKNHIK